MREREAASVREEKDKARDRGKSVRGGQSERWGRVSECV